MTRICRLKPFDVNPEKQALTPWSIYAEGLKPPYDTVEKIKELFENIEPVHHVYLPESRAGVQKFFGFCFVEFDKPQSVHKAVRIFNRFGPQTTSPAKEKDKLTYLEANKLADELGLRVMTK
jgi:RNA recognition motif-containing protein